MLFVSQSPGFFLNTYAVKETNQGGLTIGRGNQAVISSRIEDV